MKTITLNNYFMIATFLLSAILNANAAGPQMYSEVFSTVGVWTTANSATIEAQGGKVNGTMALQSNSKYRCDLKFNASGAVANNLTLDPAKDVYLAIKFIGTRPNGACKMEFNTGASWLNTQWNSGWPDGEIKTSANNSIYYFKLTKDANYTGTAITVNKLNIIIADAVAAPYSYSVDWIATFTTLDDITSNKDWKDDGDTDTDEVSTAVNNTDVSNISIYNSDNGIVVNGTTAGEVIKVYNLHGTLMISTVATEGETRLNLSEGMYIVKHSYKIYKIAI